MQRHLHPPPPAVSELEPPHGGISSDTPLDASDIPVDAPDDANDLRGFHFRRLLGKPLTWVLIGVEVAVIGVLLAAYVSPAVGGAAAVAAFLLGLLVVFAIADSRAEQGFFETYATQN